MSRAQWKDGTAHAVVLARGDDYSDALVGVPFAAQLHGPLLLTDPKALDSVVEQEIRRTLGDPAWGGTVHIVGGADAVSPAVEAKLVADGYHVVRDAGTTRFGTALAVAKQFGATTEVVVATGDGFADALSAGPLAAARKAPLILSDGSTLDPATLDFAANHATIDTVGLPATAAVQSAGLIATPYAGPDRYRTSLIAARAAAGATTPAAVGVATGRSFADGLTGGAYAANAGIPLVLIDPWNAQALADSLTGWLPHLTTIDLFGGPAAVPATAAATLATAYHATLN